MMDTPLNEATRALIQYRECCRSLWNLHLQRIAESAGWDVVDDFREICKLLFDRMVADRLDFDLALGASVPANPYLRIVPAKVGMPIWVENPRPNDSCVYWDDRIERVTPDSGADLQLIDFFDWENMDIREFQYYEVLIRAFVEHPDRIGKRALVEVRNANVELVENEEKAPERTALT
jgi:hypothetical protein